LDVSIVIVQRERFSSITESLKSLFATIENDINVVVVEGATPKNIRDELAIMQKKREFTLISFDYFITPNEARNIGLNYIDSEYVVFADNDICYQDNWLKYLYENARKNNSDFVAPLICIGPPLASKIHHAGGDLEVVPNVNTGRFIVSEKHRLMNKPIEAIHENPPLEKSDIVEFHCFLARKQSIQKIGGFDEVLTTREQIDFCLRNKILNNKVTFESKSIVTYMAFSSMSKEDLPYHIFRWSLPISARALNHFTKQWMIDVHRKRILIDWIQSHRYRAIISAYGIDRSAPDLGSIVKEIDQKHTKLTIQTRPTSIKPKVLPRFSDKSVQNLFDNQPQQKLVINGLTINQRPMRVAGLATMPSRGKSVVRMVETIINQVDRLYVFLDRFSYMPDINHEKIVSLRSQDFGDLRANGKLLGLLFCTKGTHYYCVDDDILYPHDYCSKISEQLTLNPKAAIGVHGNKFKNALEINDYRTDRQVFNRSQYLSEVTEVDIASTDTIGFSTSDFMFDIRKWRKVNRVDLCLNIELESRGIKRLLIPRKKNWVRDIDNYQADSIFSALLEDCSEQTSMANAFLQDKNGTTSGKAIQMIR
jgi:GT2 family glycosyltransferase